MQASLRRGLAAAGLTLVAALPMLAPSALPAQSVVQNIGNDFRNVGRDLIGVWRSPLDARGRDWLAFAGTLAAGAVVVPIDDNIDRWAVRNDSAGRFGFLEEVRDGGSIDLSGKQVVPIAAGFYVLGLVKSDASMREAVLGCLTAWQANSLPRKYIAYKLIGRQRPYDHKSDPDITAKDQYQFEVPRRGDWGSRSFPGGHVANAVACASFWSNRFSWGPAEAGLWALALGTGVGRIVDRGHWTSDQIVGGVYGYAVGKVIAQRSRKRMEARRAEAARTSTGTTPAALSAPAPILNGADGLYFDAGARGVTLGWRRTF